LFFNNDYFYSIAELSKTITSKLEALRERKPSPTQAMYSSSTSCARGDTICLRPLQVVNIFAFIRQVAVLFRHNNIFVFIRQVAPVPACCLF